MRDGKYVIAVMSVGGGVGESVIVSCNLSRLPIITVGFDMNPFAYGAYDCDYIETIPAITSPDYLTELLEKCDKYQVDLIMPGLDNEAMLLAEHRELLHSKGLKVVASDYALIKLVRDKEKMCKELTSVADVFVTSYGKDELKSLLAKGTVKFPLIAKPKDGSASAGIEILLDEKDIERINDNHMIQQIAVPHKDDPLRQLYLDRISKRINSQIAEISIQIVNDFKGNEMGRMMSYNKLKNGVPIEIVPYDNKYVWGEVDKLLPTLKALGHKGPLNIQGRLTDDGLKLFEMNARFTGITGLRAMMGFNEVESCIISWLGLGNGSNELKLNEDRCGIRQVANRVVSVFGSERIRNISKEINGDILKTKKTIMITGASGNLAQNLIRSLSEEHHEIVALSRDKDKIQELYKELKHVKCFDNNDIETGMVRIGSCDLLIHCAFARDYHNSKELISSLEFTGKLFSLCARTQIPDMINISSQSVYGTTEVGPWSEECPINPESLYGQAKYSSELMASSAKDVNRNAKVISLRLSDISGGEPAITDRDIMTSLVKEAVENQSINVMKSNLQIQRLDIRDAVDAINALMTVPSNQWPQVLNLAPKECFSIVEAANFVKTVGEEVIGSKIDINMEKGHDNRVFNLDSTAFRKLTGWENGYRLEDTVRYIFEKQTNEVKKA